MTCVYSLPPALAERLEFSLRSRKNRGDAMALALYLARHWSGTRHLGLSFPIDRRALAERSSLGLSESRVRGAIAALEATGFLARQEQSARYQRTAAGPHRRPILFQFGSDYMPAFEGANRKSRRVHPPRPLPALTHKQPLSRGDLLMGELAWKKERPRCGSPGASVMTINESTGHPGRLHMGDALSRVKPLSGIRLSPEARRRFA